MNDIFRKEIMFALVVLMAQDGVALIMPFLLIYTAWAIRKEKI